MEATRESELSTQELKDLVDAKKRLENPGITARLASTLGMPIEKGLAMLPANWSETVTRAVRVALLRSLEVALGTIDPASSRRTAPWLHKVMIGASGAIGGAFGLPALVVELPVSTTLILRAIGDVAREEGHDVQDVATQLTCLEVFALGGKSQADDASESAYWAVRAAMSHAISDATAYFAKRGFVDRNAPAVVRLITALTSRFGIIVSKQVAAKAIPVVGAASGTIINVLFMDHFQSMARGHFIVKRLEKKYGIERVKEIYDSIAVPIA